MHSRHRVGRRVDAGGFTLIEAVVVIALVGVVAAMVAVFIARPVNAYIDQARRAELSDVADTALRRVAREIAKALPNSVRVDASGEFLEFIPVRSSGRYRSAPDSSGNGAFFTAGSPADTSFDVLGPTVTAEAGDQVVIYNLGLPGADAYAGDDIRALTTVGSALATIAYATSASGFPFASPSNRFQIVGTPVTYACVPGVGGSGSLRRYAGYAVQGTQPADATAAPLAGLSGIGNSLVAESVESCSFDYSVGPSARIGLVTMRLTLAANGERLTLVMQAHVDNSP